MRERILDAAEWCFGTLGVSRTSMALIATRAKCTRDAIHSHFPGPIDLLKAILDRGRLPLPERLDAISLMPPPLMPALRACLHQCLADVRDNERVRSALDILTLRCDFAGNHHQLREILHTDAVRMMKLLRHIFARAGEAGELRADLSPASCASLIGFALAGAVRLYLVQPDEAESMRDAEAALDTAFAALVRTHAVCTFSGGDARCCGKH